MKNELPDQQIHHCGVPSIFKRSYKSLLNRKAYEKHSHHSQD